MKIDPESRFDAEGKPIYTSQPSFNLTTFRLYKQLIRIRRQNPVLSTGEIKFLETDGKSISYIRYDKDNTILVLLNADVQPHTFHFDEGTYQCLQNPRKYSGTELELRPLTGFILKKIK
jgi:cyclomaltodextrinase / maltogenic alpha-amylase / neopullulanase